MDREPPPAATVDALRAGGCQRLDVANKDCIGVLSKQFPGSTRVGENVEPAEIEEAAGRCNLINQIVVIGQNRRRLGAIIIPNNDEVLAEAKRKFILGENGKLAKDKVMNMIYDELKTWTADCSFRVGPIMMVDEPFTIDSGLMTPTMKIRRDKVTDKYRREIEALFK